MDVDHSHTIQVPDIAVREIGALHLQLAVAQQRIVELERQMATLLASQSVSDSETTD
ncbi:MAG: hypothetical protein QOI51_153 [Nocardioidaceae bacterium]|jgi:hypothetical protein|nr:hypothetical protein [Nocardioidaceae bacterium]